MVSLSYVCGCTTVRPGMKNYTLDYDTKTDAALQSKLESLDSTLRGKYGMTAEQTAVGVLDLRNLRLAMVHPDRIEYAASVAKIGILFAYFQLHPEASRNLNAETKHELGLMIKASSNEMAAKYSRAMGLREIQQTLNAAGFGSGNITEQVASGSAIPSEIIPTLQPCASCCASTFCWSKESWFLPQHPK